MAELHRGSKLSRELIESLVFAFQLASQTLGHMQEHFRVRATNFLIPYNGLGQVCVRFKKIYTPLARKWICIWIANLDNYPSLTEMVLIWKWCQNAIQPQQVRHEASGFTLLLPPYRQSQINMWFNSLQFSRCHSEDIRTKFHKAFAHCIANDWIKCKITTLRVKWVHDI